MILEIVILGFILYVCYCVIGGQNKRLDDFFKTVYLTEWVDPTSLYGEPFKELPKNFPELVYDPRYVAAFNNNVLNSTSRFVHETLDYSSGNNNRKEILMNMTAEDISQNNKLICQSQSEPSNLEC